MPSKKIIAEGGLAAINNLQEEFNSFFLKPILHPVIIQKICNPE